jgi:hypothetical protein
LCEHRQTDVKKRAASRLNINFYHYVNRSGGNVE